METTAAPDHQADGLSGHAVTAAVDSAAEAANEDSQARSATYAILASLLHGAPEQDLLDYLCHIDSTGLSQPGTVGEAWIELSQAAKSCEETSLDDDYHDLFIGLGRGKVIPHGSWHMTGFLMDKPLSDLRNDLKTLGFVASEDHKDPEDHISALCETMSILITAADIEGYQQRRFFIQHIHPWASSFFDEVTGSAKTDFYKAVGRLGRAFMALEDEYLNIQDH